LATAVQDGILRDERSVTRTVSIGSARSRLGIPSISPKAGAPSVRITEPGGSVSPTVVATQETCRTLVRN